MTFGLQLVDTKRLIEEKNKLNFQQTSFKIRIKLFYFDKLMNTYSNVRHSSSNHKIEHSRVSF